MPDAAANNLTDPNEAAAWLAGRVAALADQSVASNPHRQGTGLWIAWDRGWKDCEKEIKNLDAIEEKILSTEREFIEICCEESALKERIKKVQVIRKEIFERLELLRAGGEQPISAAEKTQAGAVSPADWGRDPIEVLGQHGLSLAKVESLRAAADAGKFTPTVAGLRTLIATYDLWSREIRGCGEIGANKIADALTSYLTANPMAESEPTAAEEKSSEAAAEYLGHAKPAAV